MLVTIYYICPLFITLWSADYHPYGPLIITPSRSDSRSRSRGAGSLYYMFPPNQRSSRTQNGLGRRRFWVHSPPYPSAPPPVDPLAPGIWALPPYRLCGFGSVDHGAVHRAAHRRPLVVASVATVAAVARRRSSRAPSRRTDSRRHKTPRNAQATTVGCAARNGGVSWGPTGEVVPRTALDGKACDEDAGRRRRKWRQERGARRKGNPRQGERTGRCHATRRAPRVQVP